MSSKSIRSIASPAGLTVLLLHVFGCHHGAVTRKPAVEDVTDETTVGPGDVLELRVYGEEHLTAKYQVGPEGSIRFPFLGAVQVQGKEANAVAQEIAEGLKKGGYFQDPHVSVFVEQSNSRRVSVIGAVAKPGTLAIMPGMTVVQAVSQAGGFTPLASKDETVVTRRVDGKLERYRVPVSEITRGNVDDFAVRSGDIIYVPERVF